MRTFNGPSAAMHGGRRQWTPPALKTVGPIAEVLRGGGGKLSTVGGDPGEGRKQSGGGG